LINSGASVFKDFKKIEKVKKGLRYGLTNPKKMFAVAFILSVGEVPIIKFTARASFRIMY
jgi:hypothetical protein